MHGAYVQASHRHIQDNRIDDDGYLQILDKPDQFFVINVQHTNSTPRYGVPYNGVIFTEHSTIKIFY